jgi:hypothetical protein
MFKAFFHGGLYIKLKFDSVFLPKGLCIAYSLKKDYFEAHYKNNNLHVNKLCFGQGSFNLMKISMAVITAFLCALFFGMFYST